MAPLPEPLRLPATRRFQRTLDTIVGRATPSMTGAWDRLDNYDESSVPVFAAATERAMLTVKTSSLRSALGYYTVLAGVRPPAVELDDITVDPDMRAPFIATWLALGSHRPWVDAVEAGRLRIEAVVTNLAQSSARQTGDRFFERTNVTPRGWERVTNAGACPWCEEVAGQIYPSADSADFGHDRCRCSAVPQL